jgi:hypothetical protein
VTYVESEEGWLTHGRTEMGESLGGSALASPIREPLRLGVGAPTRAGREAETELATLLGLASLASMDPESFGVLVTDDVAGSLPLRALSIGRGEVVADAGLFVHRPSANPAPPGSPSSQGNVAPVVLDLSELTCSVGEGGLAAVFLDVPRDATLSQSLRDQGVVPGARLGPAEVVEVQWPAVIILPLCSRRGAKSPIFGRSIQDQAFFDGGADVLLRPLLPVPKRARVVFLDEFHRGVAMGSRPEQAFLAAEAKVRSRWKRPRLWAVWSLSSVR